VERIYVDLSLAEVELGGPSRWPEYGGRSHRVVTIRNPDYPHPSGDQTMKKVRRRDTYDTEIIIWEWVVLRGYVYPKRAFFSLPSNLKF
jgi:hypothetical protein